MRNRFLSRTRQIKSYDFENISTRFRRIMAALVRAVLVVFLITAPFVILPSIQSDTQQVVTLVALCVGGFVYVEYSASYPSLIEFRDAPPFNRIRFVTLLLLLVVLSLQMQAPSVEGAASRFIVPLGQKIGAILDFPYSPARLASLVFAQNYMPEQVASVRNATAVALVISLVMLAFFVIVLWVKDWPNPDLAFNVWVNLPTFEPTAGGDVLDRLEREARLNLACGCLVPFVFPAIVSLIEAGVQPLRFDTPQTLIWTISLWMFVFVSLLMRSIALKKVAQMVRKKRALYIENLEERSAS